MIFPQKSAKMFADIGVSRYLLTYAPKQTRMISGNYPGCFDAGRRGRVKRSRFFCMII